MKRAERQRVAKLKVKSTVALLTRQVRLCVRKMQCKPEWPTPSERWWNGKNGDQRSCTARLHRREQNVPGGFEAGKRYELICSFMSLF